MSYHVDPFVSYHLDNLLLFATYYDALLFNTGVVLMFVKMILLLVVQVREILSLQILNNKVNNSHLLVLWNEKQERMMAGIVVKVAPCQILLLGVPENLPVAHCYRIMFSPLRNLWVMGTGIFLILRSSTLVNLGWNRVPPRSSD